MSLVDDFDAGTAAMSELVPSRYPRSGTTDRSFG